MPRKEVRRMDGSEATEKKHFAIILGQVLQRLREEREMSLLAVAKHARIAEATLCRYEYGSRVKIPLWKMTIKDVDKIADKVRVPDLFTSYKIAAALGITLDALMEMCINLVADAKIESKRQQGGDV